MADEFELDLDKLDADINKNNKIQERITGLSTKVKETAEERDAERSAREAAERAKADAEKERDFFREFSGVTSKYQGASEFQDAILEKVRLGYSTEDATVSVLNANGKLTTTAPVVERETPAGGSAVNAMSSGVKPINEMSREEKRAALLEAEQRGEIGNR